MEKEHESLSFLLTHIFSSLDNVRRIDGNFAFAGQAYFYSAYKIEPASGDPIIRIDIKANHLKKG